MNVCGKCKRKLKDVFFHKDKNRPNGLACRCKLCCKAYKKTYYKDNKEKVLAISSAWAKANRDKCNAANARWVKKNYIKIRSRNILYGKKKIVDLTDTYIKEVLNRSSGLNMKHKDIPPELVLLKRAQLLLTRELRSRK